MSWIEKHIIYWWCLNLWRKVYYLIKSMGQGRFPVPLRDTNKRYIKNLSNLELTQAQRNLLSRWLKFIPTPVTNESHIRTQLLNDFKAFARRMRLQSISYRQDKGPHSFHVKSNWEPPVQLSVTLESDLEEVKTEPAEVKISKPKNNLPINERQAL